MKTFRGLLTLLWWLAAGSVFADPDEAADLKTLRQARDLSLPSFSESISAACLSRAHALADAGVLSHADEAGRGPGLQMLSLGFPPGEYGEVLGSAATWEAVWKAWQASVPHRDVLTAPGWTQWGWAAVRSGQTLVWVVRFYRP